MTSLSFIPGHGQWEKAEPLNSGWSGEEKYRLSLRSGKQLLLRLNPKPDLSRRRYEYEQMLAVYDRRVIMPRPVEYGANQTHSWLLLEWIDGVPLESALPHLDQTRQYELGLEAGRALRVIHRVPAPSSQEAWESRFNRKIDRKIELYRSGPLRWHAAEAPACRRCGCVG